VTRPRSSAFCYVVRKTRGNHINVILLEGVQLSTKDNKKKSYSTKRVGSIEIYLSHYLFNGQDCTKKVSKNKNLSYQKPPYVVMMKSEEFDVLSQEKKYEASNLFLKLFSLAYDRCNADIDKLVAEIKKFPRVINQNAQGSFLSLEKNKVK